MKKKIVGWIVEDKVSTFGQRLFVGVTLILITVMSYVTIVGNKQKYSELIDDCIEVHNIKEDESDEIIRLLTVRMKQIEAERDQLQEDLSACKNGDKGDSEL